MLWPLFKGIVKTDSIHLSGISVDSRDLIEAVDFQGELGQFVISDTEVKIFSGEINIDNVVINRFNMDMSVHKTEEKKDTTPSNPADWRFNLNSITISDVGYSLEMAENLLSMDSHIDTIRLYSGNIDLLDSEYNLDHFYLLNGEFGMKMGNKPDTLPGFNPEYFKFSDITIDLDSFLMKDLDMTASLKNISLKESKGFDLKQFSGFCHYDPQRIKVDNMELRTSDSYITADVDMDFSLFADTVTGNTLVDINASFGPKDITFFIGNYIKDFSHFLDGNSLLLSSYISGKRDNFNIKNMSLSFGSMINADLSGDVHLAKELKDLSADINIILSSCLTDLHLADNINMPDSILMTAQVKLKSAEINAVSDMKIDRTNLNLTAGFGLEKMNYDLSLTASPLDIKAIMPSLDMPSFFFDLYAKGKGFDFFSPSCETDFGMNISRIGYKDFSVEKINLSGALKDNHYNLDFSLSDTLANLDLNANGVLYKTEVKGDLNLNADNIALHGLNVSKDKAFLSFNTGMSYYTNYIDTYKGDILIDSILFDLHDRLQPIRDMNIAFSSSPDSTYVRLNNGDLSFFALIEESIKGFTSDIDKFTHQLSSMTDKGNIDIFALRKLLPPVLIQLTAGKNNILHGFLMSNNIYYNSFNASIINQQKEDLRILFEMPELRTSSMTLKNSNFSAEMDSTFNFELYTFKEGDAPNQQMDLSLRGELIKDSLSLSLNQKDGLGNIGFDLGLNTVFRDDTISLSFDTMNPVILYSPWKINEDNYIDYSFDNRIKANLSMQSPGGMTIYVKSDNNVNSSEIIALNAGIKDFNLSELSASIKDFPEMKGFVNVDVYAEAIKDSLNANLTVAIDSLVYQKQPLDKIAVKADYSSSPKTGHYVESEIIYDNKEVSLLNFLLKPKGDVSAKLGIHDFPLKMVNPFIPDGLIGLSGTLKGYFDVEGHLDAPVINGELGFTDTNINIGYANADLKLSGNNIEMINNVVKFDNFRIDAYNNNPILINGQFNMADFKRMSTDIRVTGNNVELINVKKQKNKMLYGKMYMDVNTLIKGPVELLKITGSVNLLGGTDFTYVLLDSPVSAQNRVGNLVEFTNFNDTIGLVKKRDIVPLISGIDIALNLSIAPAVEVGIDLSANGSDRVELIGGGDLAFLMNPRGDMEMTGRYELSGGFVNYNLPVLPVAKTFMIQNGSYVEWRGNLLDPYLNIIAAEKIRTTVSEEDKGSRVVNFEAYIKIMNSLNNIDISFDLAAPEDLTIQNQIASMTSEERAKQALSLIVTQMYTGPGTTAKLNSNNALTAFIQKEINQFAGDNLGGIDISFGIDSYDQFGAGGEGGKRTDYSFRFSKKLFNDRFKIVVGASVSSGQDIQTQQGESFINDIILEYTLDKSATRYLKLFHHTNYESLLEGEIIETGVGIVLKRKIRRLRQLFIFKEEKRKKKIETDPETLNN